MAGSLPRVEHGERIGWTRSGHVTATMLQRYEDIVRRCGERGIPARVPASELNIIAMEHDLAAVGPAPRPAIRERTEAQIAASLLRASADEFRAEIARYERVYELAFENWVHARRIVNDAALELLGMFDPDLKTQPLTAAALLEEILNFKQPRAVVSLKLPTFDDVESYRLAASAVQRHIVSLQARIARTMRVREFAEMKPEARTDTLVSALVERILELSAKVDAMQIELNEKRKGKSR